MKLNQKGFNDTIVVAILGGILGALFITSVFVWQEINYKTLNITLPKGGAVANEEEVKDLKEQITQLESMLYKEEALVTGSVTKLIGMCQPNRFVNLRNPVDQTIENSLRLKNDEFNNFINEGYVLANICSVGRFNLIMLDKRLDQYPGFPTIDEDVIVGYANSQMQNMELWQTKIDDYRPGRGGGEMACNFLSLTDDTYINYICLEANDGFTEKSWYSFDISKEENIKVKYTYSPRYSGAGEPAEDEMKESISEVYREDLLDMFGDN